MRVGRPKWRPLAVGALLLAALVAATLGTAPAAPTPRVSTSVLAIYQSPSWILEQSNLTVGLKVSDATHVKQVYFTFCQLTSSLCYLPVTMAPQGGNWFVGSTGPMTQYHGMSVGVRAGYNITILFDDNTNITEPSLPNAFTNLTIAQSITGENMFEMTVEDHLYGLSGVVTDPATGAAIPGAVVSLTPGNGTTATTSSAGAYSFSGLANGTYSLSVVKSGFTAGTTPVTISGKDAVENLAMTTNNSTPSNPTKSSSGGGFLSTPMGEATVGVAVGAAVVVAAVALILLRRNRSPPAATAPEGPEST